MAVLDHPTADNTFTIPGVGKAFIFTSTVNDADTFACPMAHPRFAQFISTGIATASSVGIGTLGGSTVTLTINLGASVAGGVLLVYGTGY